MSSGRSPTLAGDAPRTATTRSQRGPRPDPLLSRLTVGQARVAVILAGGAIGTLCRAGVAEALPHGSGEWPWATFIVNLAGAFVLGWLVTRLAERTAPTRHWRFFAGTGFCGALTTFSTFQLETFTFARDGDVALAIAYPVVSIVCGVAVAAAGVLAARWGRYW